MNRIKKFKISPALFFLIFLPSIAVFANANEEQIAKKIRALLLENKIEDAYEVARTHRNNFEGSYSFDYALGLVQRASGELNQAVFTFERILQFKPKQVDSLYMLAVSYYELGNLEAAKNEFTRLSELALPSNIETIVNRYLLAIDEQQKRASSGLWNASLQLGAGNDSNPNNGIVDEFITIPTLGDVRVFDGNRELSSNYIDANGQISITKPITQKSKWFAAASVLHVEFDNELALSRTFVDTRLGYQRDIGKFKFDTSTYYQPIWLAGESFLQSLGANIGLKHPLYQRVFWGAQISYSQQKYIDRPLLNRDQIVGNLWIEAPLLGGTQRFSGRYGNENAEESNDQDFIGREFFGFGYQWSKSISQQWGYKITLDHLISEYNGLNPLFVSIREDDFIRAELELRFRPSSSWLWLTKISHINNDSETPIFKYRRSIAWLGARYTF